MKDMRNDAFSRTGRTARRWEMAAVVCGLIAVTIAAYWGLWNNDFVKFDDDEYVQENLHIAGGLTPEGIRWAFTTFYASNWHPVTWLSHMLDVNLFGMWAGGHHLTSLLIHVLSALLLLGFLMSATRRLWPSAAVAALFALHPLHVESVAWVSERKDVLSCLFWMATMWAYLLYVRKPRWPRYLAVVALFALGLMSKPMLVTLPLVLLLLDYWPLERFGFSAKQGRFRLTGNDLGRILPEKAPLLVLSVCSALVTLAAQKGAVTRLDTVNWGPRLTNVVISYGRYICEMLWPAKLTAFYPFVHKPNYPAAIAVILLLAAATAVVLYRARSSKFLVTGWLWYLATLVPVIGLVQVGAQSHADRYTYIPLVGVFIIIAFGAAQVLGDRPRLARPCAVFAAVVLVAAGVMTQRTVGHWKDTYTLAIRGASLNGSFRMLLLLASSQMERGEFEGALVTLRQAEKIKPDQVELLNGLGHVMLRMGRFEEALRYCDKAMNIEPRWRESWLYAGMAFQGMGKHGEAEEYLRKAIELDPDWAVAYSQLGSVLGDAGRVDEGIALCRRALELAPALAECHFTLGLLYMRKRDYQSAAVEFTAKNAIEPEPASWSNLGACMAALKRPSDAEAAYRESIRLEPNNARTHHNLAVVLADLGRIEEAIAASRKAVELDPSDAERQFYRRLTELQP